MSFGTAHSPSTLASGAPAAALDIRPLSPSIGVEVRGIDLSRRVDPDVFTQIRRAWEANCVAFFPGQHLSEVKQLVFASLFGKIGKLRGDSPAVVYVTNAREVEGVRKILPEGPVDFHSDQSYVEEPSMATLLYAIQVPGEGGATRFSNGFSAYEALPTEVKSRLKGRRALHAYDLRVEPTRRPKELPNSSLGVAHPIFRLHPPSGRLTLYVDRLMTRSIVGMDANESKEMLDFLFAHQERPEFVYEHDWTPGDLLVWDNRSCLHARTDFPATELRLLRRVTVLGDRPVAEDGVARELH